MMTRALVPPAVFAFGLAAGGCALDDAEQLSNLDQEIIGGTTATGDSSIVALFIHAPGATSGSLCTGTVIAPRKVLTAAHCVDPRIVGAGQVTEVVVGTTLTGSPRFAVSSTVFNPAWNPNNLQAGRDVGIATLAEPIALAPIPIIQTPYTDALAAQPIRIVGFGTNNHTGGGAGTKRTATTNVVDFDNAVIQIGTTSRQTCHGDSGGPALQTINGVETVVGITSFGMDLLTIFQCFGGGFDARVDVDLAFINANL